MTKKMSSSKSQLSIKQNLKALSLFSNIGVSEALLQDVNIDVVLANEYIEKRANLYSKIYPDTQMLCGDFNNIDIFNKLIKESKKNKIDIVIATPPCQGMSNAGLKKKYDERNQLIIPTLELIEEVLPKYVFIENVSNFLKTYVKYNDEIVLIPDLIKKILGKKYNINIEIVNTKDYKVPQSRIRAIILMSRKDIDKNWKLPKKSDKVITMKDAIGNLPIIDPFIKDIEEDEFLDIFPNYYKRKEEALKISPWHNPPIHVKRQVVTMMYTPTNNTAFDNKEYKPVKENGDIVKGFKNTYKRQCWNSPASTITMDNRKISSQNNVHPGRFIKKDIKGNNIYSDARALTLYEIMKIMTLPENWPIPIDSSESFIRSVIGEGIPPLFMKQVFESLTTNE